MLPVHPIYNVSDATPRNSCHILKLHVCIFSRLVHFSNLFHVLFSKFTHSVLSSVWHNAFARRIQGVFCACTNPQVRGINTRGIVTDRTIMANKHSTGNGSEMKNPTCPVCPNVFLGTTPTPNHTVFVWPKLSIPYPARFGNKDFFEKPFRKVKGKTLLSKIFCRNSELLSIAHNMLGHASGCLLVTAEAFLLLQMFG